ncbi:MAG: hypothetical protein ACI9UA_004336, partial [Pseudoalteromonas tetraodonis]
MISTPLRIFIVFAFSFSSAFGTQIDLDGDGMGDVWEQFYNTAGLLPGGDEDGDAYTNLEESRGGTDPFDASSSLGFSEFSANGGQRELTWGSIAGKHYWLQSSGDLVNWERKDDAMIGSGGSMTMKLAEGDAGGLLVGAVLREVWRDVPGKAVADLTSLRSYPAVPTGVQGLSKLECPPNDADEFGARVKGYIIAPRSGLFWFSVSAKDSGQFWLSSDTSPANLKLLASSSGETTVDGQVISAIAKPIDLQMGEVYYFELLHKADFGDDYCSVSWKLATQTEYEVVPGQYLAAWIGAGDPVGAARRFYRLEVDDVDSDSDGASDWEEVMVSYDPFDKDSAVEGMSDGDSLAAALAAQTSSVEILAVDDTAYEEAEGGTNPVPGVLRVTRSGALKAITVFYGTSGKATVGEDYVALPGYVTFGFGETQVEIEVVPVVDSHLDVPQDLTLLLQAGDDYEIGAQSDATVEIQDYEDQRETLFVAQLGPEGAVSTPASGFSSIRLSGDHASCFVSLSFSGLTSNQIAAHIHAVDGGSVVEGFTELGQIMNHYWEFPEAGQGIFTSDQAILDALQGGGLYVNVHSSNFPAGEIRGEYSRVEGSIEFDPPEDPPALPPYSGEALERDVARLLTQATFGPTEELIDSVVLQGIEAWVDEQLNPVATPASKLLDYVLAADAWEIDNNFVEGRPPYDPDHHNRRRGWWVMATEGQDQLRQRVAFALSEILVVSEENSRVRQRHQGAADYYDVLVDGAFGNFRDLLEDVTLHPIMGWYLSMIQNEKANGITQPDENYAREVMQLFTIGLLELHPDGTLKLDPANLLPVQTYDNYLITELARVFTGWSYGTHANGSENTEFGYSGGGNLYQAAWLNPMKMFQTYHDEGAKELVWGDPILPGQSGEDDMDAAMDALFNHPNTGPFIAKRLIQRLVTSNPSRGYVYRVAQKFDDNGSGVRGDLGAVVKAILLDFEARSQDLIEYVGYGKQ